MENLGCNQEESSVVDTYATSSPNFTLHWLISVKEQRTWRFQWRCVESSHHFHSDVLCKKVPSGGGGYVCGKKLWGALRSFSPIWFMGFEDILSYFGDETRFLRISETISHRVLFVFHRSY